MKHFLKEGDMIGAIELTFYVVINDNNRPYCIYLLINYSLVVPLNRFCLILEVCDINFMYKLICNFVLCFISKSILNNI